MRVFKIGIFIISISIFSCDIFGQSIKDNIIYAFRDTKSNTRGRKMVIVGETVSIEKATVFDAKNQNVMLDLDTRPDVATVRISFNPGIKIGQKLYLIEKHPDHASYKDGNIVGEITVKSIFNTTFFGQQLRGIGKLRLVGNRTLTVAMDTTSDRIEKAIIAKKKGDYYFSKGDIGNAIKKYKESIHYDSLYPEVHLALGKLHMQGGEGYISAGYEYRLAWKHKHKFLDKHEKFDFYKEYMKFLLYKFKVENKKRKFSVRDLLRALEVSKEALKFERNNFDISLYTAKTYYYLYKYLKSGIVKQVVLKKYKHRKPKLLSIEESLENTEKYIQKAQKVRAQEKELHKLAIFYYAEKLNNLQNKPSDITEEQEVKNNLYYHAKNFKKFKLNFNSDDRIVLRILERIEAL